MTRRYLCTWPFCKRDSNPPPSRRLAAFVKAKVHHVLVNEVVQPRKALHKV